MLEILPMASTLFTTLPRKITPLSLRKWNLGLKLSNLVSTATLEEQADIAVDAGSCATFECFWMR